MTELKDQLLKYLCDICPFERGVILTNERIRRDGIQIDDEYLRGYLNQFERQGLLELQSTSTGFAVTLRIDAKEFLDNGGFKFQDEILFLNLRKLELEINSLSNTIPETAQRMATILGTIFSGISLFKGG